MESGLGIRRREREGAGRERVIEWEEVELGLGISFCKQRRQNVGSMAQW